MRVSGTVGSGGLVKFLAPEDSVHGIRSMRRKKKTNISSSGQR